MYGVKVGVTINFLFTAPMSKNKTVQIPAEWTLHPTYPQLAKTVDQGHPKVNFT